MDDFQGLFQRAKAGDRDAVEDLLGRHLNSLRGYVRLRSGHVIRARESHCDLVQSICREMLNDLGDVECDSEGAFRRWLFAVAHHKILHRAEYYGAQKRNPDRERPLEAREGRGGEAHVLEAYSSFCTPSRDASIQEEVGRIEAAFDSLPEDYRDVILKARFLGQSAQEISEATGRSELAVRKLLSRARARLALLLEGD